MPDLTVTIISNTRAEVFGRWSAKERITVNDCPDRFRWVEGGVFRFDPTPANIQFIRTNLVGATWVGELASSPVIIPKFTPRDIPFRPKTPMMDHQKKAFEWQLNLNFFGLFLDKGLGKTKNLLDILAMRFITGQIDGALVLAPNGVHRQWVAQQVPLHWPDNIPMEVALHTSAHPVKPGEKVFRPSDKFRLLSMNIEALSRGQGPNTAQKFLESGRMAMVIDESTRIRNMTAATTNTCLILGPKAAVRIIASGNPIPHGIENYYSQLYFLSAGILGYSSYQSFLHHYCVLEPVYGGPRGAMEIVGYRNGNELAERIKPFTISARKEDCIDLPPKLYEEHYIETTPQQRAHYNSIRKEFLIEVANKTITLNNALTRLIRMQQVLSGYMPIGNDEIEQIPFNRIRSLDELLVGTTGKTVIWARFREDLNQIEKMMIASERKYVRYDGSTVGPDRDKAVTNFTEGTAQYFISNPAAGGIGLNLQVASTVIYYTNSFNSEHREQSEDRTHRIGTKSPVTYIDFVVPNSLDESILSVLRSRTDFARMMMEQGPTLLKELK